MDLRTEEIPEFLFYASIAQLAEHVTLNHQVPGSSPGWGILRQEVMMIDIILGVVTVLMLFFAIGSAALASEEKEERHNR